MNISLAMRSSIILLVCASAFAGQFYAPTRRPSPPVVAAAGLVSVTNGLIAYYPFTGNGNDAFGSYNLGVSGAIYSNGIGGTVNTAIAFDGIDDVATNYSFLPLPQQTAMTISAWFQPRNPAFSGQYAGVIMGSKYTGEITTRVQDSLVKWQMLFTGPDEAEYHNALSDAAFATNSWYYITATFSAASSVLYLNGTQQVYNVTNATPTFAEISGVYSNRLCVGASDATALDTGISQYFTGLIDELRIYNRALSAAEVQTNYLAREN